MKFLRLGLWLLMRERASGEWRVLLLALAIGVGSVATTGFLGDRLQRGMGEQGAGFLGADLLVISPRPMTDWPALPMDMRLRQSQALEFASMVSRGEQFQLVTLRAVDEAYPLRGSLRIASQPFDAGERRSAQPPAGAIYVAPTLLPLLNAQVGDVVQIGDAALRIAGIVAEEPGQMGGFLGLSPRVFMRLDEVARTNVLQPGSRLSYLYQFAGEPPAVNAFKQALQPQLNDAQRMMGAREGSDALRGAFAKVDRYIQLTALISLLLSVAAIAVAAHRHAVRHYDQAALLRCMGASTAHLRRLYGVQLLLLGLLGSLLGILVGVVMQHVLMGFVLPADFTGGGVLQVSSLSLAPVGAAVASGLLALAGGSLPALMRLIQVPPLRVLRRDLPPLSRFAWLALAFSVATLLALIALYAGEIRLSAVVVVALVVLIMVLLGLAQLALLAGRVVQKMSVGPVRFGLAQLLRHRFDSTLQLGAFTLALFLVALLALVRTDLVDGWRAQLPANAPNYFFINIAPHQQAQVANYLAQQQLRTSAVYPMVRGRLISKNGLVISEVVPIAERDNNTLRRELNLTWTATLPDNNPITAGRWHGNRNVAEISVESRMAERLNLTLGDELGFQVGDQTISARITSLRNVQWATLQPNFFVIFAPGQLDAMPTSGMVGVYVPPGRAGVLPEFVKTFPGVTVIALDKLIANVQAVFAQIIAALQLLLGFLLAAGMAVVVATLLASLDARLQEAVLLRTLGAKKSYLTQALAAEFIALGVLSGLLASACAELAMSLIAEGLFDLPMRFHPWLWGVLPLAGVMLVGVGGWLTTRHITRVPPMQSIRALG